MLTRRDQGSSPTLGWDPCTFPQLHSVTLIPALYILYTTIFSPFPHFICQSADMETVNGGGEDDNETLDESNVPRVVCLSVSLSPPYSFCCLWSAAGPAKSLISVSYCTHNSPTATALRLTFNPPGLVRLFHFPADDHVVLWNVENLAFWLASVVLQKGKFSRCEANFSFVIIWAVRFDE